MKATSRIIASDVHPARGECPVQPRSRRPKAAEAAESNEAGATEAESSSAQTPADGRALRPGDKALLGELTTQTDLNGQTVEIVSQIREGGKGFMVCVQSTRQVVGVAATKLTLVQNDAPTADPEANASQGLPELEAGEDSDGERPLQERPSPH